MISQNPRKVTLLFCLHLTYLDNDCLNAVSSLEVFLGGPPLLPLLWLWRFSLDLLMASLMSQRRSLDLERLFLRLELRETFSKMASRDLDRYRFRSVAVFRHVWHDLKKHHRKREISNLVYL